MRAPSHPWIGSVSAILVALGSILPVAAGEDTELRPLRLRTEYRVDPVGLGVRRPRFSWTLESTERGQRQTAYHLRVASRLDLLRRGEADLWDTGRIESDRSLHVTYGGTPLRSRARCWWSVRVWGRHGRPSTWSRPARFTIALLEPEDWCARWIGAPGPWPAPSRVSLGYRSRAGARTDSAKWIILDLGRTWRVDGLCLYPACPWDPSRGKWGAWSRWYPMRFRLDVSPTEDFSTFRTVLRSPDPLPDPTRGANVAPDLIRFCFPAVEARFVRLWVDRLRADPEGRCGLALADLQVLVGEVNVAVGARVRVSDSDEDRLAGWSTRNLVDGVPAMKAVGHDPVLTAAPMMRKAFRLAAAVRRATLHATALGVYELRLNGKRVGDRRLAPEWTDPDQILHYQTYEVSDLLRVGDNAIGAMLGDGWQRGKRGFFGGPLRLLAQLEIEDAEGRRTTIATDGTWRASRDGPVRWADLFQGEGQDLRRERHGWDQAGFDDRTWTAVHVFPPARHRLIAQPDEPLRVIERRAAVKVSEPKPGRYVLDFGQNMVGWCCLRARGAVGTAITVRHAERLPPGPETPLVWEAEAMCRNDVLYRANLGRAAQEDRYILAGWDARWLEPHFTCHGFRYAEVSGLGRPPVPSDVVGCMLSADVERIGRFACSSPLLNRLMENVYWSARGNLSTGVLTYCPQRSERLGWLGDAQVFSRAACFTLDMAAFLAKWCRQIRLAQSTEGVFTDIVPSPQLPPMGSAGWADAGVILPWRAYAFFGDRRLLADHYVAAKRWVEWLADRNREGLRRSGFDSPGDWLNGASLVLAANGRRLEDWPERPMNTDPVLVATAYWVHIVDLVASMAEILGHDGDRRRFRALAARIRAAFRAAYVLPDGRIRGDTQGGYGVALAFDLVPENLRDRAVEHVVAEIRALNGRLSTGILTTPRVLEALTDAGRVDVAYRAVFQQRAPSWGHMIEQGATTIWERWDGFVPGRGFQDPEMNSFNHCAFGSVGGWIFQTVVGLRADPRHPGFKHFTVAPKPGGDLTWARGEYESAHGRIVVHWSRGEDGLALKVTVPANTTATVHVPAVNLEAVEESGRRVAGRLDVQVVGFSGGFAVLRVPSGVFTFRSRGVRFPPLDRDRWWGASTGGQK